MKTDSSSPILILILAAIVLIVLSMIFSATESAFLSINKLRVQLLRNKKNKQAVRAWKLLNDRERLINTLLVGNNIVNIAISSILTYLALDLFGDAGVGIATFVATMLLLVFGEITPKTFATHHPEPIAFFFSGFIFVVEIILYPLVFVFTAFSRVVLLIFHVNTKAKSVSFTHEEIKAFIDVGGEQGVLAHNEKNMLRRVFTFSDLEAKDIMIPRKKIKTVPLNASYKTIVELSERMRLSRFPVERNGIDDIVGILYVKDLLFYKENEDSFVLSRVMRPPLFILETKKMSSIQQMLRENRQSLAVVIDEYSGTQGVLTSEDIAREIFGPISDEYKPYAHRVEVKIKNLVTGDIDGLSRLLDLNEQLNIHLESKYNETLGGYICENLGHIPVLGESIISEGYKWTILKMDENRVAKVRYKNISQGEKV